ncbi:MAG TPA: hypothetical protein VG106_07300 [Vicinamibacterales bacterium]|nr:hypothetical protein [Vicinamibacterales bacterium]
MARAEWMYCEGTMEDQPATTAATVVWRERQWRCELRADVGGPRFYVFRGNDAIATRAMRTTEPDGGAEALRQCVPPESVAGPDFASI